MGDGTQLDMGTQSSLLWGDDSETENCTVWSKEVGHMNYRETALVCGNSKYTGPDVGGSWVYSR